MNLVLSLFPGIGLLDMAFEMEGFCVVQSRDWIMGGDVRNAHFPAGRFDGVIGGPPCQAFSRLSHIVRANGYEPKFGNLIPEFQRAVSETQAQWFVMENVPEAPAAEVEGYDVYSYILNNRQCFDEDGEPALQNRKRRWSWGWKGTNRPQLLIDVAVFDNPRFEYAATGGSQRPAKNGHLVAMNKGGKLKKSRLPFNSKSATAAQQLCQLQGVSEEIIDRLPFRKEALCKALGNGVPLPMGRAIARAVREAVS